MAASRLLEFNHFCKKASSQIFGRALNTPLIMAHYTTLRSSRSQMLFIISVFKNFVSFKRKHLCWSLFLKKLQSHACTFIEKRLQYSCFLVKFVNFLRTPFLQNTSGGCFCTLHKMFSPLTIKKLPAALVRNDQFGNEFLQSKSW